MFRRKTLFIVGAGASHELGLPLGSELTGILRSKLDISFNLSSLSRGDRYIVAAVEHYRREIEERDPNPYYAAGRSIANGMGNAISIDNYLHAHAGDERITFMGKLGIAATILESEASSKLAITRDTQRMPVGAGADSWLNVFFQMLTEGVERDNLDELFSHVAIITFNYDRCIEHYLYNTLETYFKIDSQKSQELVSKLVILHPYGRVGTLPWQARNVVATAFGNDPDARSLPRVASQIRTFTERVDDDAMMTTIHHLMSNSEVIVYLGFSYADMNIQLLTTPAASGPKLIFGTSYLVSQPNKNAIVSDLKTTMGADPQSIKSIELADLKCRDMLLAYWRPILRGP